MADRDPIKYAKSGDVAIAYAVAGDGPRDLVFVHGFAGNIEIERETPHMRAFQDRLASFSRFITFDRRGTGLSDRLREPATLEARMDDLRAVLDAVGSERAVLFGTFEAASMCLLFAATYPERTFGLALYNPVARGTWAPDYPWAPPAEDWRQETDELVDAWGTYAEAEGWVRKMAASYADNPEFIAGEARARRLSASPGAIATIRRMAADVDIRDVLGAIRVPTLIANMPEARGEASYVATRIPDARRFEVPGPDFAVALQLETLVPELGGSSALSRSRNRKLSSPPFSSPTSSGRRRSLPSSATPAGANSSSGIMCLYGSSSAASAGARSTRPGTASLPRSTARSGRSGPP